MQSDYAIPFPDMETEKDIVTSVSINCSCSVEDDKRILADAGYVREMLEAFPGMAMILNNREKIVAVNTSFLRKVGVENPSTIEGLRFGSAVHCSGSSPHSDTCGEGAFCTTCKAHASFAGARNGKHKVAECSLALTQNGSSSAFNFRITIVPLHIGGREYSVASLTDINEELRQRVLERMFFHDILNSAGGIAGLANYFAFAETNEHKEIIDRIQMAANRLINEIESQRDIMAAESGELRINLQEVILSDFLHMIQSVYSYHEVAAGKQILVEKDVSNRIILTDPVILGRAIGNLVKNALEAIPAGEKVGIGVRKEANGAPLFCVHNPGFISSDIQTKLFYRTVSTKGFGRGIGTYAVKLFIEKYLNGSVDFTSTPAEGTCFFVKLPPSAYYGVEDSSS